MSVPKFSFIIPIFNAEDHLKRCLDSVLSQTLNDIEVICVDDASTDGTSEILSSYSEIDNRIRIYTNEINGSSHAARKRGVFNARGEYIWFVDADDEIDSNACGELYSRLFKSSVDILHFSAEIINDGNLPQKRIDSMSRFIRPRRGNLRGASVFEACFERKTYGHNLWNKVFKTELCKKAFSKMNDLSLPKGQDKYEYFAISFYADSYHGIAGKAYYRYHFGAGATGRNYLSVEMFERYCTMAKVSESIQDFLVSEGIYEKYGDVLEQMKSDLFQDCFNNWVENVSSKLKDRCFDIMVAYWDPTRIISKVAERFWSDPGHFAKMISDAESVKSKGRDVKTIATFYFSLANGGVQRVLSGLTWIWVGMGYNVVLITDMQPSEHDYSIPDEVKRITIPAPPKIDGHNYAERAEALRLALIENSVDVMVYHAWTSSILLWDLLICKLTNVPFISHNHNVFSMLMTGASDYLAALPRVHNLCDGIVTLSEVDKEFWSNFNTRVYEVQNPLTFNPSEVETSDLESDTVLWLGRMSEEKRPLDAIKIMKKVVETVPNAKLVMVGGGNIHLTRKCEMLIRKLNLKDSVEIHGYTKDVFPFYKSSSIFLSTSEYEGFPTTFTESGAAGLPCITYQMPYLTISRESGGIIQVPQGDIDAAAKEVINLLGDVEIRREIGNAAWEYILSCSRYDYQGIWKRILNISEDTHASEIMGGTNGIMWDTVMDHYRIGVSRINPTSSYTILIRKGLKNLKNNGVRKTARLVLDMLESRIRQMKKK